MGLINTCDLQPDMVLGSDLYAPNGRFLLGKGTVLEPKHIRIMTIWGVPEADIAGVQRDVVMGEAISQINPLVLQECEEWLAWRFRLSNRGHPVIQELFQLALLSLSRRVLEGACKPPALYDPQEDEQFLQEHAGLARANVSLESLVARHLKLCTLPDIYHRIVEVLQNPRSSAMHIADVVSKDVSLSARLLRLVNSPFYGFPGRIDTVQRAVTLLGSNELTTLAHGITVVREFENMRAQGLNMRRFWEHSVACGLFARALAGRKPGLSEERFFVAGLLHDIGRLVLLKEHPEHMHYAMALARVEGLTLCRAELRVFGFDHTQVASRLLRSWHFPADLERMITFHHAPLKAGNLLEASFVNVADCIALALNIGSSGSPFVPSLETRAWDALETTPGVVTGAARHVERQLDDIVRMFFGK
ncbi:HDOD domain-containing protein [Megalodesulfovibrio gigas]|uniref:Putative metal dependent phosphohydrolase n=1 Tax=Megalodesulfovibrio gigas (strain ATCC 19364 / DSM 1382 / NCIMB 9332 / VKM B-1759) TaxID=1121448 RepID=T2G9W6_MEGG1|nr:HDOD domain-containing protein [Megalodesulfovibrio gigas]AGW12697.1 putative metal dependent phosphohydrolase [Megalodesulfovibrio gigas DSM 1382 = ATCC 19364]